MKGESWVEKVRNILSGIDVEVHYIRGRDYEAVRLRMVRDGRSVHKDLSLTEIEHLRYPRPCLMTHVEEMRQALLHP